LRTFRALALSTHPGPAVAVTLVAVLLSASAGLPVWRVALLGVAFLLNQASVGLSNDWLDAARDIAVGRTDKPVALGLIRAGTVRNVAFGSALLAIVLTIPLGLFATIAHAVFIISAWLYNVYFKKTVLSVVPYIVSFGLLPLIVTLAGPHPLLAAPWSLALGALLGVAAHCANVLPDLADDERTGIRGLPHRLGRVGSGITICGALLAAAVTAFFGPGEAFSAVQWVGLVLTVLLTALIAFGLRRPPTRLLFQLIIAAALVNVVLLLFSGSRLYA
jgi:4-hydroxybenzoate polyprenyltransferase